MQCVPKWSGLDDSLNSGVYWDQDALIFLEKGKRTFEGAKTEVARNAKTLHYANIHERFSELEPFSVEATERSIDSLQ
jgi:hypothetical protein